MLLQTQESLNAVWAKLVSEKEGCYWEKPDLYSRRVQLLRLLHTAAAYSDGQEMVRKPHTVSSYANAA